MLLGPDDPLAFMHRRYTQLTPVRRFVCLLVVGACASITSAQRGGDPRGIDPVRFQELRYRLVGPFRAGRTVGGMGVPSRPGLFYMGVNNGGVWKTDDYGRTWRPIFDSAATGSVGDVAVAPSNPDIIYIGSGEGLHRPDLGVGDGIFKSDDGGRTWRPVGLSDVQQVGRVVVHPTNPDIVFVAGMGHPFGPNDERGVFRSVDGGGTWDKVLFVDRNTGAGQVEIDPSNPSVVYAALWNHREAPWENGTFTGPNSGLYKSTDGGATWHRLSGGLPDGAQGLGRIAFAIAESAPQRIYAIVPVRQNRAIYRSDDAGSTWQRVSTDERIDVDIRVHPKNPDVVFAAGTASYKSEDGGRTWTAFKGAPGGDDYQRIWIDPLHPDVMLFTADQGATITVNGGTTWSSWYNQPTAQLYHVATDTRFPYWIYGGQQESGAIGIASRGNGGQISFRDWMGVGADEYAYVAPDPLNSDVVYGGRVVRFNRRTGQTQNIAPEALRSGKYRILRTMPLLFHPLDPKMLLFATNVLWKTTTGGQQWEIISPDLSREHPEVPDSVGDFRTADLENMSRRGVIYAVAASSKDVRVIWAGTDDGLVHLTRDGGRTWKNVTPPAVRAWEKVSQIDAGHGDAGTAYVSVNAIRRDDMRPHIYRTHDAGATWTEIVSGLPAIGPVNVVREDPKQPGLLFAGTERQVYFSVDDGSQYAIWSFTTTIWWSAHTDDRSGFWTACRCCASWHSRLRARALSFFRRPRRRACAGICFPTRRCRRKNPPDKMHPTAPSSTTSWPTRSAKWCLKFSTSAAVRCGITPAAIRGRQSIRRRFRIRCTGCGHRRCYRRSAAITGSCGISGIRRQAARGASSRSQRCFTQPARARSDHSYIPAVIRFASRPEARPPSAGSTCAWIRAWRRATPTCGCRPICRWRAIAHINARRSSDKRWMPPWIEVEASASS
jgi:photosystem II stability/assembly factor-like uncharacterized protein